MRRGRSGFDKKCRPNATASNVPCTMAASAVSGSKPPAAISLPLNSGRSCSEATAPWSGSTSSLVTAHQQVVRGGRRSRWLALGEATAATSRRVRKPLLTFGLLRDAQLFEPKYQGRALHAEFGGRTARSGDHPAGGVQHGQDVRALHFIE